MQEAMSAPRFVNAEMLSITFETDVDYLKSILPPPLELTDSTVRAMVGRWQSNCVGDFEGGALYLPARHQGVEGEYVLAMYMSSDAAIIYGRELFGEPKKQGTTRLHRGRQRMIGQIERHGVIIIDLEAELLIDRGPSSTTGANFNIKATPSCTGVGLESDAVLTLAEFDVTLTSEWSGTGSVRLASNPLDPIGDIPVGDVREAIYQEGELLPQTRMVASIPATSFLPYAYGRLDDWSLLNTDTRSVRI